MKMQSLYDAGYKAGINGSIELVLKSVMVKLYSSDWPAEAISEMAEGIQDAIFYYAEHREDLERDVKIMEDAGIQIRFTGKR